MKIKIDENLPEAVKRLLLARGHDCHSVHDEGIAGGPDDRLIDLCRAEDRVLLTLDLDFSNIITYPPKTYRGIVVLRLPRQDVKSVCARVEQILPSLESSELAGHLFIVDEQRIRIR